MPAASTTRRSCISPQRPRTCGARRAVTSCEVSIRSCSEVCRIAATCSTRPEYAPTRPRSTSRICSSTLPRVSRSGATRPSIASCRLARSPLACVVAWVVASRSLASASRTNASLLRASASPDSAWNASRSRVSPARSASSAAASPAAPASARRARSSAAARSARSPSRSSRSASRSAVARAAPPRPTASPATRPATAVSSASSRVVGSTRAWSHPRPTEPGRRPGVSPGRRRSRERHRAARAGRDAPDATGGDP